MTTTAKRHRAFSLVELIVVLAVTILLTGLLFPSLSFVRENVHRVVSSSNLRQIGLATAMYDRDYDNRLPYSYVLEELDQPEELMVVHLDYPDQWDGLGLLYEYRYCDSVSVFYNPAYTGTHHEDAHATDWLMPDQRRIYSNYHYAGHREWEGPHPRKLRSLDQGRELVLATDGLRTASDFSHEIGMNILRGDGSVSFREDPEIITYLPAAVDAGAATNFHGIWRSVIEGKQGTD